MNTPRLSGLSMHHPTGRERQEGEVSRAELTIDRGLKGGRLDVVPLGEDDLVRLIARAAECLAILRGVRT